MLTRPLSVQLCRLFGVEELEALKHISIDGPKQAEIAGKLIEFVSAVDAAFARREERAADVQDATTTVVAALEQARMEAVDALRAAEARFALAIENSGIAVWEADLTTGEAIFRSAGYHRMLGYETVELPRDRHSIRHFLSPESVALLEEAARHHQEARTESCSVEVPATTKDGGICWVKVQGRVTLRDEAGRPLRMIGTNTDVTAAHTAAETLRLAKEAAEAASRAKGEFLANMSHEIRTPMNGVLGLTDLCLETTLTRDQRTYLEMIRHSAVSLMTVINDVLDFSKIEAGKIELDPVPLSLRSVLAEAVRTLAFPAHAKGLELTLSVDPSVPDALVADGARIRQVLINLVGNAVKFTEAGEVSVYVSMAEAAEPAIRIAVRDTGIGIPPQDLTKVFESFSQGDSSITRRFAGTGLGLAISARLVALLGGELGVTSELGHGSEFSFTLPAQSAGASERAPATQEFAGHTALIVEDNATSGRFLQGVLEHRGMRVEVAWSAAEALDALRALRGVQRAPDVLLLDAQLHQGDGHSLVKQLREEGLLPRATIMMLSTLNLGAQHAQLSQLGLETSVTKPVIERELLEALRASLRLRPVETRASAAERAPIPPHAPGLKILLVEDNAINQLLAVRLLAKLGHETTVADNGEDAVKLCHDQTFDLVLMDLQMPTMGGVEATHQLRALDAPRGRRTPVIAMTAHALMGDRERCLATGMDEYIAKPVVFSALSETIQRALQRNAEAQRQG